MPNQSDEIYFSFTALHLRKNIWIGQYPQLEIQMLKSKLVAVQKIGRIGTILF